MFLIGAPIWFWSAQGWLPGVVAAQAEFGARVGDDKFHQHIYRRNAKAMIRIETGPGVHIIRPAGRCQLRNSDVPPAEPPIAAPRRRHAARSRCCRS